MESVMSSEFNRNAWHSLTLEELYERLGSGEGGLENAEISHRLEQQGRNTIRAERGASVLQIIGRQVHNPLIYLLLGAAGVSVLGGHVVDAVVIGVVVVLNTLIGAAQEWKADKALDALRSMAAPQARVLRDGHATEVSAEEIVPGDVLMLETGDRVAADARLLESSELQADESALTGESEPVHLRPGTRDEETPLADRTNMVWTSTAITGGRGRALVVATGMDTVLGRIAGDVQGTEREETPLQKRLARLGAILGFAGIGLACVVFLLGLFRGYEWLEMVLFSVAVAVSAIPEGMPAVISVTLALGVQRMAKRHAIIRRLPAVETLGSTTVICSDKTGTITRNEMTVTRLWTLNAAYEVAGSGFAPEGEIRRDDGNEELCPEARVLLRLGALNNNAEVAEEDREHGEGGEWVVRGTPTDGAILVVARKAGLSRKELEEKTPRLHEIPFSSENKYMASLHPDPDGEGRILYVKGGADRVLSFCTHAMVDGEKQDLTEELRARIEQANAEFADDALRVLAGAVRPMPADAESVVNDDAEDGLVFIGLWGLVDPARPEAIEAIAQAREAGIRVVMITGDHAATAAAIAREVGIASDDAPRAVTGAELDRMDDEALKQTAAEVNVYARVSPSHKLRILRALKSHGEIVSMTGDGVNDAPALKGADIGVAMGRTGTEVAKEAADMVLTDDDFATIMHAVEEGRAIYANLKRVVFFLITTNLGEIITLAVALLIGLPLPLTAVMILWINLVTDGACTIPLGIEPMHRDVLKQPPRAPNASILDRILLRRMFILAPLMALGTLGLFAYSLNNGGEARAMTIAFTTLAAFQWFHGLNARTSRVSIFSVGLFSNPWLWFGIGLAAVLQVLAVHTVFGQSVFKTVPLSLADWAAVLAVSSSILLVDEILKALGVHGRDGARS
jgi:P-type Ca2+ transporter type 2C